MKLKLLILCYLSLITIAITHASSFLYVASDNGYKIIQYKISDQDGSLSQVQSYSLTGSPGKLKVYSTENNPNKFLFVTLSNTNKLVVFRINENTGSLSKLAEYPTANAPQRIFMFGGAYIYITSPSQYAISGFNFNPDTGQLTPITGSPFKSYGVSGSELSPNGQYLYEYNYTNPPVVREFNQFNGTFGPPLSFTNKSIDNNDASYIYKVNTDTANGIAKYKVSNNDNSLIIPDNKYNNVNYKLNYTPNVLGSNGNYLYISDNSNYVNIFNKNTPDGSLLLVDRVNCGGYNCQAFEFTQNGYAYETASDSYSISEYRVDPQSGELTLFGSIKLPIKPISMSMVSL
ncbi:MAG: hypothetical protein RLZZ293_1107 [Pseudomonadota bacterium]|jgi:6-phosphogluconolactonase (cycloisomerase 2 family)